MKEKRKEDLKKRKVSEWESLKIVSAEFNSNTVGRIKPLVEDIEYCESYMKGLIQAEIDSQAYKKKISSPKGFTLPPIEKYLDWIDSEVFKATNGHVNWGDQYNQYNADMYSKLKLYFTGQEQPGVSLDKGIGIIGPIGVGKSTMLNVFKLNYLQPFNRVATKQVVREYEQDGPKALNKYLSLTPNPFPENKLGHKFLSWFFDDIGAEDEAKYFGATRNLISEIFLHHYDQYQEQGLRSRLMWTSNDTLTELEKKYGSRWCDRLIETTNIFQFSGNAKSLRK